MAKKTQIPLEVANLIPHAQYECTVQSEEDFSPAIERLSQQLAKCPKIRQTDGATEHPAIFHYFYGSSDLYICEYDGEDTMYGYSILGGDLQCSEWGYISLAEITGIPQMNIDYYFEEQSIEAALYRQYPGYFENPALAENNPNDNGRYKAQGCKDRNEYLASLAKNYGIPFSSVRMIADLLGPSEDFDGLVSELEDFAEIEVLAD